MHRRSLLHKFTAVTLTILLIGLSSPAVASPRGDAPRAIRPVDGETLFIGLYFGRGPAAAYFPEFWENPQVVRVLKSVDIVKSIQAQNRLMDLLRQRDATIFTRFGDDMQSGNQVRVRDALNEMRQRVEEIATEQGVDLHRPIRALDEEAAIYLILAVVAIIFAFITLIVEGGPAHDRPKEASVGSNLERDLWIDSLTHRLDASRAHAAN
jgi:SdpC family antimicrobial peptide